MKEFSLILPAYNEEGNIESAVKKSRDFFAKKYKDFEIIVVNDGSQDKTAQLLEKLSHTEPKLRILTHPKNLGYGAAVYDGLKAAKGKLVFFMDSDLQFDIRDFDKLEEKIADHDVVLGFRKRRSEGFMRAFNAFCWKAVAFVLLGLRYRDIDCAFKLFRREVIENISIKYTGATFSPELLFRIKRAKYKVAQVPVRHYKRQHGSSTGARLDVVTRAVREIFSFYKEQPELEKSRSAIVYILSILVLLLSRIFFMSNSTDFFDATQYMARTQETDLWKAISTGHSPFHPLYIFFSNIFYKIHLGSTPIMAATWPSVIFGSFSIVLLFIIVKKLFDSRIAWISSIIYALAPFIFVAQVTIMVDPTMHFFFYLALLLFILAMETGRNWRFYLFMLLSGLSLSLAALTHTQVAFWTLAFVGIFIIKGHSWKRENAARYLIGALILMLGVSTSLVVYTKLLIYSNVHEYTVTGVNSISSAFRLLVLGNAGDREAFELYGVFSRCISVTTTLAAIFGLLGLLLMFIKREGNKALGLIIWALPCVVTATYIYENLYGRAIALVLAPVSILIAYLIVKTKKWGVLVFLLVAGQLLFISIPALINYKDNPAPNELLGQIERESQSGGVFISSNVARTWSAYNGKFVSFGDVGVGSGEAYKAAATAVANMDAAYVSSDAIYLPFWRYDGEYFDIRSRNIGSASDHPTDLTDLFAKMNVTIDRVSSGFKQTIYRISNSQDQNKYSKIAEIAEIKPVIFGRIESNRTPVSNLTVNLYDKQFCKRVKEDWTRNDFISCLWRELSNSTSASNWSVTDKDGWFYMADQISSPSLVAGPNGPSTRSADLGSSFAAENPINLKVTSSESFDKVDELQHAVEQIDGSFYVIARKENDGITYQLNRIDFTLAKTTRLEAERLGGAVGSVVSEKDASRGKVRTNQEGKYIRAGFVVSGPYLDLPKGQYQMSFSIKADQITNNNSKLILDVVSAQSGEGFVTQEVDVNSLAGQFNKVQLRFNLEHDTSALEFRVKGDGSAKIMIDYLELEND